MVKYIDWDTKKNEQLKIDRGVSFENIIDALFHGTVIGTINHPNQKKYSGQKIYIIIIHDYVYIVPYVEDDTKIFLKTIFPSRKYTRDFIEKGVV